MKRSIRRKVFVLLLAFSCFISVMFAGIAFVVSFATEDKVIENVLNDEVDYLRERYKDGLSLTSRLSHVAVFTSNQPMPLEYQELLASASSADQEVTDKQQRHWHIKTLTLSEDMTAYVFLNATSWLALPSILNEVSLLLFLLLVASFTIAFAIAYGLTRKITRPLIHLSELVTTQPQAISSSLEVERQDEIGNLARSFQRTLSSLQGALTRESDFTRDVGHELRTPIAVIKNYLTLQQRRPLTPDELSEQEKQINYVSTCVDSLMALARAEVVEKQTFYLRALIEETLMNTLSEEQLERFDFRIDVPYDLKITAHKALCIVLIRNLIGNAVNYAQSPEISIEATQSYWRFSNSADSVPEIPLSRQSKGKTSEGIGQGLYLVERIAAAQEWKCDCSLVSHKFSITFYWSI
ncbi:sensor histidine kinase [Pseudidiomarina aestuarii]|uniref:sensor histidine kinase n=1 Tax=Pseudidiomarina aestuarii TaxID=624146 RepID=UPI003A986D74